VLPHWGIVDGPILPEAAETLRFGHSAAGCSCKPAFDWWSRWSWSRSPISLKHPLHLRFQAFNLLFDRNSRTQLDHG
jgi:hypothetical protein